MFATLVLLVLSAAAAFGGDENVAYFDNFQCTFNSNFCDKTSCILTPHNNKQTEQTSTVTCDLKKSINEALFKVTIFAKELQANLVDIEEDFCGFMSGKADAKVLAVLIPFIKKHSNINHPCPYTGSIQINELPLGSHLLESHDIPAGDYMLYIQLIVESSIAFNTTTMLHIPEGKSIKSNSN